MNGRFATHICPTDYCDCTRDVGTTGCFYDFKKPDDLCVEGRRGRLCGGCKGGLALSLNPTKCMDCDKSGAALAVSLSVVILLTLVIIVFNSDISADLRGILFYIQVLPYNFRPNDGHGLVNAVSGFADLGRPTEYPFKFCAAPGLNNLRSKALNFVTTPLIVVVCFVSFMSIRNLTEREKPFQCFFSLIIIMCKTLLETSFTIMHCVDVGGMFVLLSCTELFCIY